MTDTNRSTWKFDLERWKAGEMPETRSGFAVRSLVNTGDDRGFPLVGYIADMARPHSWRIDGKDATSHAERPLDLVHPPRTIKVRTVWIRSPFDGGIVAYTDPDPNWIASQPILRDEIVEVQA